MSQQDNGNVLFLILIAVALFAALSYAVTNSTRSGGGNAGREKAGLAAAQIVQYGSAIETAIMRMRLSNGCSENDISFETPLTDYEFEHTPPVADKCKLFSPAGGGVAYQTPETWFDSASPLYDKPYLFWATSDYAVSQVGTAAPELTISLWGIKKEVCAEINKKLGISDSDTPPMAGIPNGNIDFIGEYPATAADTIAGDFIGKPVGCINGNDLSDPGYVFYHTVIVR